MANPFVAEIRIFGGNFATERMGILRRAIDAYQPEHGTVLSARNDLWRRWQNHIRLARPTRALTVHQGQGPGLTSRQLGEPAGVETVTLTQSQIPMHTHAIAGGAAAAATTPGANLLGKPASAKIYGPGTSIVPMSTAAIGPAGQNQAHDNRQPYLRIELHHRSAGNLPTPQLTVRTLALSARAHSSRRRGGERRRFDAHCGSSPARCQ